MSNKAPNFGQFLRCKRPIASSLPDILGTSSLNWKRTACRITLHCACAVPRVLQVRIMNINIIHWKVVNFIDIHSIYITSRLAVFYHACKLVVNPAIE